MANELNYDSDDNHVERRDGLSARLRASMIELPRSQWSDDPRFRGEPAFWLEIHKGLLGGSAALAQWSEQFCDEVADGHRQELARQLSSLGRQLVHHAHGHHHIEDHHFFPAFLKLFPQLEQPLELLDGDHKVLADVLHDLEDALAGFPLRPEGTDKSMRDRWLAGGENLHRAAKRLDDLFIRHIGDEEEICIPAMLKLG